MQFKKIVKIILLILLGLFFIAFFYLFIGKEPPQAKEITFGVTFSQKHATDFGLNWKEVYSAILDDLRVKNLRLIAYWDLIEPKEENFNFEDLDWQIQEAEKRGADITLVMGIRVPRWPECHIPVWAKNLNKSQQQEKVLNLFEKIVLRYKNSSNIQYWQVENEPFFPFGTCPWSDIKFLKKEIEYVRSLDQQKRPIIETESGEWSPWVLAGKYGDIVGTTMYKKVFFDQLRIYINYPLPPLFYWRKAQIVKKLFGNEVICIELQAEPWGPSLLYDLPLEEQKKTMSLEQFRFNIEFAKKTGLKEFSLWGAEWWYWMKEIQGQPEIWQEAKKLF